MKKLLRIAILFITITLTYSCQHHYVQQNQEKITNDIFKKIAEICPGEIRNGMLVYYFDGDCAICLGKASYVEKYANARGLKPVLIAKTLNPAEFNYNVEKLNVHACVYIEKNREFENHISFMKVAKIDADRNISNYDKEIESNQ